MVRCIVGGVHMRSGVRRVSREELLDIAKERTVLLKTGVFWVNVSQASKEWLDKTLFDVGEYEIREENGMIVAQYIG